MARCFSICSYYFLSYFRYDWWLIILNVENINCCWISQCWWLIGFEIYKLFFLGKNDLSKMIPDDPCQVLHQVSIDLNLIISWAKQACSIARASSSLCISFGETREGHRILIFYKFILMMSVPHTYFKWHKYLVVILGSFNYL